MRIRRSQCNLNSKSTIESFWWIRLHWSVVQVQTSCYDHTASTIVHPWQPIIRPDYHGNRMSGDRGIISCPRVRVCTDIVVKKQVKTFHKLIKIQTWYNHTQFLLWYILFIFENLCPDFNLEISKKHIEIKCAAINDCILKSVYRITMRGQGYRHKLKYKVVKSNTNLSLATLIFFWFTMLYFDRVRSRKDLPMFNIMTGYGKVYSTCTAKQQNRPDNGAESTQTTWRLLEFVDDETYASLEITRYQHC